MFYYFRKCKNTTEKQQKKNCATYEEGTVTDQTHQKWFEGTQWTQFHSLHYQRKTWVCDRYLKCFMK